MNERILLYRDDKTINDKRGNLIYVIRDYLQPLADELNKLGLVASQDDLFAIILSKEVLTTQFKEKASEDTKLMPSVTSFVEEKYLKQISSALNLAINAKVRIDQSEMGMDFFIKNILVSENWEITIDPKYIADLEEMYSEYVDSDERKEIWEGAHKLMEAIENFQSMVIRNRKENELYKKLKDSVAWVTPDRQLNAISYEGSYNNGILEINSNGEVEFKKENLIDIR